MAIAGTGTFDQPASLEIDIPVGATVVQVLAYWEGQHSDQNVGDDDTITIAGSSVTGTKIGGSTFFFTRLGRPHWSATFRADVTALALVNDGTNNVTIDDMDFDRTNNGAGLIVIYDDGGVKAGIDLVDGNDLAFIDFDAPLNAAVPQTLTFDPAPIERVVQVSIFASSVAGPDAPDPLRPNAVSIIVDGVETIFDTPLQSNDGDEWDTITFDVPVPAGVGELTVEPRSVDLNDSGNRPASFAFSAALVVAPGYVPEPASLGDRVWKDLDGDGVQDAGEPGVPGVTVKLWEATADGTPITEVASTTTADNGFYDFQDLTPGQPYVVQFIAPPNMPFTLRDQGTDDADSDADTTSGITGPYVLDPGEYDPTVDAGLIDEVVEPASLGDRVWKDVDSDGKQDSWEWGLSNQTVNLWTAEPDGTPIAEVASTTTDGHGRYRFDGLTPGQPYVVEFESTDGYLFTQQDAGSNDAIDSDANTTTGITGPYVLAPGEYNATVDAGLVLDPCGSVYKKLFGRYGKGCDPPPTTCKTTWTWSWKYGWKKSTVCQPYQHHYNCLQRIRWR